MQIAAFPLRPDAQGQIALHTLSKEDRTRLSAPGLRAFRAIAEQWGLSEAERLMLLGEPGRSTYHQWMKKARDGARLTLPLDTLLRVSAILGIYKALAILHEDQRQALAWLMGPHRGTDFAGASPMDHMLAGGHDGLMMVRRYLDAWRGGAPQGPEGKSDFAPVTADDLVFI